LRHDDLNQTIPGQRFKPCAIHQQLESRTLPLVKYSFAKLPGVSNYRPSDEIYYAYREASYETKIPGNSRKAKAEI
jgi:hypothetical protein